MAVPSLLCALTPGFTEWERLDAACQSPSLGHPRAVVAWGHPKEEVKAGRGCLVPFPDKPSSHAARGSTLLGLPQT